MKREVEVRDGEINIRNIIEESDGLEGAIQAACRRRLIFMRLEEDSIQKAGDWKSTKESTVVGSIIYLMDYERKPYVICRKPETENEYVLAEYNRTA